MKFNISNPQAGTQKCVEIDDDKKYSLFFDRRMGQELEATQLGEDFKGYVFKVTGGNDRDGFPMKQGVLVKGRVRLLMSEGHKTYRPRRKGERKRKSVRGCIIGPDIKVLHLVMIKKGEKDIPGLTDTVIPRRLGPKRANNIRKLFNIKKSEDQSLVCKAVIRRKFVGATSGKEKVKAPKIQRLITDKRIQRKKIQKKRQVEQLQKTKSELESYKKMVKELKIKKEKQAEQRRQAQKEAIQVRKESKDVPVQKKAEVKKVVEKVQPTKQAPTKQAPVKQAPAKTQPKKK